MQKWELDYCGNKILVENRYNGEKLYVNEKLQDEQIGLLASRARLWGRLPSGERIKVSIGSGWLKMHCRIFIDDKPVLSE